MEVENRLLASFPDEVRDRLAPALKQVALSQGETIHKPGEIIRHLYFPVTCLLSITLTMRDGAISETGLIGNREVCGVNAFMGTSETTQTTYIVQLAGQAVRADAAAVRNEFDQSKALRDVLLRYTQALIFQISQNAACNRLHGIDQRLARWLLEVQERLDSDDFALTHEFIGDMLGTRRASVSHTANKLQRSGIISHTRGRVQILNLDGLKESSCECYTAVRDEYDRLLGGKHRRH